MSNLNTIVDEDKAPHQTSLADDGNDAEVYFPDGGYGWVCVACCLVINALSWGVVASYGVYLAHYISFNTFQGASAGDYAFIGGLNFAAAMAVTPFVSLVSRRFGPRPPTYLGAVFLGGGFIAASFCSRIWQLYLSQGALVGIGVGCLYLPITGILPQWFDKKRSLASAISSAGSGIGGLIFSLATGVIIRRYSVAWALRITGIVSGVCTLLAAILIRDRDAVIKPKYSLFDATILRQPNVLLLLSWEFLMLFGYIAIQFSVSDFALSIGLSHNQSNILTAVLNVGTACVRPFIGFLGDKFGCIRIAALFTLITGVFCFALWIPATGFALALVFSLFTGGIYGVFWAHIGPLSAKVIGVKRLPSLLSFAWLVAIAPTATAEFVSLKLRRPDSDRVYLIPQVFTASIYTVASLLLWILEARMQQWNFKWPTVLRTARKTKSPLGSRKRDANG